MCKICSETAHCFMKYGVDTNSECMTEYITYFSLPLYSINQKYSMVCLVSMRKQDVMCLIKIKIPKTDKMTH